MNVSSEVGISPVLLQAISQTLTGSTETVRSDASSAVDRRGVKRKMNSSGSVTHILQGMNEPVATLLSGTGSAGSRSKAEVPEMQEVEVKPELGDGKPLLACSFSPPSSSVSMMLTAIASQHLKHSQAAQPIVTSVATETGTSASGRQQPQLIIYYNNQSESVPSPANDVVVGEVEGPGGEAFKVLLQHEQEVEGMAGRMHQGRVVEYVEDNLSGSDSLLSGPMGQMDPTGKSCPVCGDKVSGYHYGVFSCESCKGFFKRTVQNKKTFSCQKQGRCDVNIYNRKKCPACRYNKCINAGMKLEAIRLDRTRGGRSSYEGCSPHGRTRPSPLEKRIKRAPTHPRPVAATTSTGQVVALSVSGHQSSEANKSHLVAILNHTHPTQAGLGQDETLAVPELLTDILNLESLLSYDDVSEDAMRAAAEGDDSMQLYNYLMQLSELRLYKLVRWARNLPQFGAIQTDDQILLLQNCWSDLLALTVCWESRDCPRGILRLSTERCISQEVAASYCMEEVVDRLLDLTQHLVRLEIDQLEFVALKVLILISPDHKHLREPAKIAEQQEKLSEALFQYTTSHYPQNHNKFGELLLRLSELARISFISREKLLENLPADVKNCGLLVELLKGENTPKSS